MNPEPIVQFLAGPIWLAVGFLAGRFCRQEMTLTRDRRRKREP